MTRKEYSSDEEEQKLKEDKGEKGRKQKPKATKKGKQEKAESKASAKAVAQGKPSSQAAAWVQQWSIHRVAILFPSGARVTICNHPSSCKFGQYLDQIGFQAKVRVVDFWGSEQAKELVRYLER